MEMPLSQSTPEGKNKLLPLPGKLLNQRKLKSFFSPFEHSCSYNILWCRGAVYFRNKQVKPGFTNYQPLPMYSRALSKIEGNGKLGKTKDFLKRSNKLNNSENQKNSENLDDFENLTISERVLRFAKK